MHDNRPTVGPAGISRAAIEFRRRALKACREANGELRAWFGRAGYIPDREHTPWPLSEFRVQGRPIARKLIALTGPVKTSVQAEALERYLERGYRIVGLSSYQEFPGRIVNPHEDEAVYEFSFFDEYRDFCIGWLHCFRDPDAYLPGELPRMRLTESDFTDHGRIRPDSIDGIRLPAKKEYDFMYVCGPGPWNAYCRNLPLAESCIPHLVENGFKVLVVGRDETATFSDLPGVRQEPYLHWYDFLARLNQCRFLFVPNIHDASPRIIAEALCLDIPILVNRAIVGGWHYVNPDTGTFFTGERDLMHGVETLLRGRFSPRGLFTHRFGQARSARNLRKFLLDVSGRHVVPVLPCSTGERTKIDAETLAVCRKIVIERCADRPRVAFLIYTFAGHHKTRCRAQYETWGKRAGSVTYFSNAADDLLPIVSLDTGAEERYENLALKTAAILRYAWLRLAGSYDWFMLGGDDLYVILDNLYGYLTSADIRNRNASGQPLYMGRRFKRPGDDFSYNSGGAGYLLNRAALKAFVDSRGDLEARFGFAEDVMVGMTLDRAGIRPVDTRDESGAERFHPFTPRHHYLYRRESAPRNDWYAAYTSEFALIEGIDGISHRSVSFHYVDEELMQALDALLAGRCSPEPAHASRAVSPAPLR